MDPEQVHQITTLLGDPALRKAPNPLGWLAKKMGLTTAGVVRLLGSEKTQEAMAAILAVDVFSIVQPVLARLRDIALSAEPKDAMAAAKLLLQHAGSLLIPRETRTRAVAVDNGDTRMLAAELRQKKKSGGRRL